MTKALEVNDEQLASLLAMSSLPVLVDFYSPYCGACGPFGVMMDIVAERYDGKLTVVKIDTIRNKVIANKLKTNMPLPMSACLLVNPERLLNMYQLNLGNLYLRLAFLGISMQMSLNG